MKNLGRYYQILGVSEGASAEDIKQAYRDLVKVWHPDRFSHDERLSRKAQEKLKEINGAYEVLRAALFAAAGSDPAPQTEPEPESEPTATADGQATADSTKSLFSPKAVWGILGCVGVAALLVGIWLGSYGKQFMWPFAQPTKSPSSTSSAAKPMVVRGAVIADTVYTSADDFVVDIYQNGERVPDQQRKMITEVFGATCEKIALEVREGDWLVFNVVNNRLRWGGVYYFGAAGVKNDGTITFTSELQSGRWSFCDNPRDIDRFIAEPDYLSTQIALSPANPWARGAELMRGFVKDWKGDPLWGTNRNTYLKFRVVGFADSPVHAGVGQ